MLKEITMVVSMILLDVFVCLKFSVLLSLKPQKHVHIMELNDKERNAHFRVCSGHKYCQKHNQTATQHVLKTFSSSYFLLLMLLCVL